MKKNFVIATAVGIAGFLAANSLAVADASTTTTITFYESMGATLGTQLQSMTNSFQKANPNIKVNLVYIGSYTTMQQKLTASIAAGQPPTLSQVEDSWEQQYVDDGLVEPLNNLLPKATINSYMPVWVQDNTFSGKLYSVPFNKSTYVLFYNKGDFKKAGIKTPPTTWAQMETDAKKLTSGKVFGLGFQTDYYTFEMYLKQAGGQDLTANGKSAAFNDAAGTKALTFMTKLVQKDKSTTIVGQNAYLSDGFNTGAYAMDIDSTPAMTYITNPKVQLGIAPLPVGTKAAAPTAGTNIALFKGASSAQQAAALKYMEYLTSTPNTIKWAEATGYLPVTKAALTNKSWLSFIKTHPNEAVGPNEVSDAFFSPRQATIDSGETEAGTEISNAVSGSESVSNALSKAAAAINSALSGN